MLMEHKLLVDVTDEELAEAPLLFLACDHIFPRDSLDGLVELSQAYSADAAGRWLAPLPLQVGCHAMFETLGLVLQVLGLKHSGWQGWSLMYVAPQVHGGQAAVLSSNVFRLCSAQHNSCTLSVLT